MFKQIRNWFKPKTKKLVVKHLVHDITPPPKYFIGVDMAGGMDKSVMLIIREYKGRNEVIQIIQ